MSIIKTLLNTIPRPWLIRFSMWFRPALVWWFRGDTYCDPIDGRGYRKFLPYGYQNKRDNVLSPGTLSLERHRLMWLFLQRKTDFFQKPLKVLHVAPEQSFFKKFRNQKNLEYTTTDLLSPLADIKADICDLPFKENSFDVVFCNHVLEHIPDDRQAMRELYRVMKNGGWGVFQVPLRNGMECTFEDPTITDPQERIKAFGQYDHVRLYGEDYFARLESVGFEVLTPVLSDELTEEEIHKFALEKGERLPLVKKN